MTGDKLQATRFELKYLVDAQVALRMREFVRGYLVPDEYSEGKPDNSYHSHSLYLDSDDLCLYWDVLNSNKNRYKLRIRYYDDNPDSPALVGVRSIPALFLYKNGQIVSNKIGAAPKAALANWINASI